MSQRFLSLLLFGLFTITGCQERNQELLSPTGTTMQNLQQQHVQIFTGGKITDGLDIGMIRLGEENGTERLVFDSYQWNIHTRTPSVKAPKSGYYIFKYEPDLKRIIATVEGYRGFSALESTQEKTFPASRLVDRISLLKYPDDSAYRFVIHLKQQAKVNVFELKAPGRIVVDLHR